MKLEQSREREEYMVTNGFKKSQLEVKKVKAVGQRLRPFSQL
jgi:hypothetical protein